MRKNINFGVLVVCFCLVSAVGSATTPPRTGILPDHPTVYSDVKIGIAPAIPPCLSYSPSAPDFYHLSANNHISYVFLAFFVYPCPGGSGWFTIQRDIGQLPAGDYTMQVYMVGSVSQIPTSINDPLGAPLGDLVNFTVYAPAASVPAIGFGGVLLMIVAVLLSLFLLKKWPIFNRGEI